MVVWLRVGTCNSIHGVWSSDVKLGILGEIARAAGFLEAVYVCAGRDRNRKEKKPRSATIAVQIGKPSTYLTMLGCRCTRGCLV